MMHFDRFDVGLDHGWGEGYVHVWSQNTGFDSSDWNCTNTTDLVNIL